MMWYRGPNDCPTFNGPVGRDSAAAPPVTPVAAVASVASASGASGPMVASGAPVAPPANTDLPGASVGPNVGPNVAPGGSPVVSNGTTPVTAVAPIRLLQCGQMPASGELERPHPGQIMAIE